MSADAPQATHNDLSQCLAQHSTEVAQIFDQRMAYSTMLFQNMQHDNAVKLLYSVDNMMVAQRNDMLKCVDKMINEASDKINQKMDATMQVAAATDKYLYTFKQLDKTSHKVLFEQQIEQTLAKLMESGTRQQFTLPASIVEVGEPTRIPLNKGIESVLDRLVKLDKRVEQLELNQLNTFKNEQEIREWMTAKTTELTEKAKQITEAIKHVHKVLHEKTHILMQYNEEWTQRTNRMRIVVSAIEDVLAAYRGRNLQTFETIANDENIAPNGQTRVVNWVTDANF